MNDPQQIRRALADIRKALDSYPREALAEVLALVFKEYVVEGGQPIASGGQVLDARSDLEGMGFAELVVWLQTHLDVPELALFEVAGADVSIRAEGRVVRLRAPTTQVHAMPASPPSASAAPAAPLPPRPVAGATPPQPAPAAPPAAAPAPAGAAPASGAVTPAKEESPAATGTRFSLLEVD
jgi:hypothetical protein